MPKQSNHFIIVAQSIQPNFYGPKIISVLRHKLFEPTWTKVTAEPMSCRLDQLGVNIAKTVSRDIPADNLISDALITLNCLVNISMEKILIHLKRLFHFLIR